MPLIRVYLRQGTAAKTKAAIADGIKTAMISELGIPDDDYFQATHELAQEDLIFDRNYFGIARGEWPVLICLSFNHRPAEDKARLFAAIAANLVAAGLAIEDIYMNILECDPANWWAHARTIDPETGTDSRMSASA